MIFAKAAAASESRILTHEAEFTINNVSIKEKTRIELGRENNRAQDKILFETIGPVYPPFSEIFHQKFSGNTLLFDVSYHTGQYGLRQEPQHLPQTKASHLIVAGDSNVFGEGCGDGETLTASLEKIVPQFHAYNFGHRGGGPHNTLSLMEHYPFASLIKEKKGVFLYNFFPAHMIERVIGAKNYVAWDKGQGPWYSLDSKDQLKYEGPFSKRPMTKMYQFIADHAWLNKLLPVLPRIGPHHLHLVAKLFERMQSLYKRSFPEGTFVVVLNLNVSHGEKMADELKSELEKVHVPVVIVQTDKTDQTNMVFKDMHYNPEGQKWQARLMADALLKIFSLH